MKLIYALTIALLLCGMVTASMEELRPYTIRVIIWDLNGTTEAGVAVTFAYGGQSETLYSAEDGTLCFSLLNFDDVQDGAQINVSCKYGAKMAPVNYEYGATGVTFNEPSSAAAIAAFAAMGFAATAIGGGLYYLKRKKKETDEEE